MTTGKRTEPDTTPLEPPPAAGAPAAETPATEPAEVTLFRADLDALRKKADAHDEMVDLSKRVQADFLNYQDRVRREREETRKFLLEELLRQILPALDALERCQATLQTGGSGEAVREGIRLAARELGRVLERHGLQAVSAAGEKFNPALHEAIGTEPREGVPPMTVLHEVHKGYTIHGRLLRPAQVIVAQPPAPAPTGTASDAKTQ